MVLASRPIVDIGAYLAAGNPATFFAVCSVSPLPGVFTWGGYPVKSDSVSPLRSKIQHLEILPPFRSLRVGNVGQLTDNQEMSGISICCCCCCCCYSDIPCCPIFLPGWLLAV